MSKVSREEFNEWTRLNLINEIYPRLQKLEAKIEELGKAHKLDEIVTKIINQTVEGLYVESPAKEQPPMPDNAKVAKALGKEISFGKDRKWYMRIVYHGGKCFTELVPDYSGSDDLALGALKKYCERIGRKATIEYFYPVQSTLRLQSGHQWAIAFGPKDSPILAIKDSLAAAIVAAIIAHSERRDGK